MFVYRVIFVVHVVGFVAVMYYIDLSAVTKPQLQHGHTTTLKSTKTQNPTTIQPQHTIQPIQHTKTRPSRTTPNPTTTTNEHHKQPFPQSDSPPLCQNISPCIHHHLFILPHLHHHLHLHHQQLIKQRLFFIVYFFIFLPPFCHFESLFVFCYGVVDYGQFEVCY